MNNPFDPFGNPPKQPEMTLDELARILVKNQVAPPPTPLSLSGQPMVPIPTSGPSPVQVSLLERLRLQLASGQKLLSRPKLVASEVVPLLVRLKQTLLQVFGAKAPIVQSFEALRKLAVASKLSTSELGERISELEEFVRFLEATGGASSLVPCSRSSLAPTTKNVFVIHGKDELNMHRLCGILRNECGVTPVVMSAKPGMSRSLSDKFEKEASTCSFAFALFTLDDIVSVQGGTYGQARPNVIYETGWFIGRLGLKRIVLLLQDGVEMHTDLQGVSRIHFRDDVSEKFLVIQQELRAGKLIP